MGRRSLAQLRIVDADAEDVALEPEQELTLLFDQEASLQLQITKVRAALEAARKRYAAGGGLQALPRMELLRTRFGTPREGAVR